MSKEVIQSVFVSLAALSLICNSCIENTPAQFSVDREFVSNADRVVSVGFAYDGKSIKDFIKAVDLANKELLEYGIWHVYGNSGHHIVGYAYRRILPCFEHDLRVLNGNAPEHPGHEATKGRIVPFFFDV